MTSQLFYSKNKLLSIEQFFQEIRSDKSIVKYNLGDVENHLLYSLIHEMYPDFTKKEVINSFLFNLNLYKNNKLPEIKLKLGSDFFIHKLNENIHSESVIEYHIRSKEELLATFSIYFVLRDKKPVLIVNNIQGFVNRSQFNEKLLKNSRYKLDLLNKELKENWRVFILRSLKKFAGSKKYHLRLELPNLFTNDFSYSTISEKEYKRQLRQYIQTALKAGLSIDQISLRKINIPSIKEAIRKNLVLKKITNNLNRFKKPKDKNIFERIKKRSIRK
jgi:hypothetical protein